MKLEQIKAVMLGHAVADALGVPVEFYSREELDNRPVSDMEGFGTYPYPAGCWSDDTSMSLCALDVLAKGKIDYDEIMMNFIKWLNDNEYTPTGEAFDVGRTCLKSIIAYSQTGDVETCGRTSEHSNGNGSLMRIHPFTLFLYAKGTLDLEIIHTASALTHAHERSKIACGIYSLVLWELLNSPSRASIAKGLNKARRIYRFYNESAPYYRLFYKRAYTINREEIKSSGYVVDTLEAAIWCLMTTHSYKECVLKAVNLGDDTDTVAAVAGGLAGALYGYDSIPKEWLSQLKKKDYIEKICEDAYKNWRQNL